MSTSSNRTATVTAPKFTYHALVTGWRLIGWTLYKESRLVGCITKTTIRGTDTYNVSAIGLDSERVTRLHRYTTWIDAFHFARMHFAPNSDLPSEQSQLPFPNS